MWAMIMPVTVVIIAVMKRRADRASDEIVRREREHSVSLAASLAERTRAEQALRGLFERNLAGIFRSRRDGRMLECNMAFVLLLGYTSREELLAHNAREWSTSRTGSTCSSSSSQGWWSPTTRWSGAGLTASRSGSSSTSVR